jgi:hypothetical protein
MNINSLQESKLEVNLSCNYQEIEREENRETTIPATPDNAFIPLLLSG